MSTINANQAANYYLLNSNGTSSSSTSTGTSTTNTDPLLAALSATDDSADSSTSDPSSDAYLLNLSSDAQSYLASLGTSGTTATTASGNSDSSDSSDGFILSPTQQQQLSDIIAKYKNAPYTQDTFDQMQQDIDDAGLGPDQLNAEQHMRSVNPTQMLIDALNGQSDDLSSLTDTSSDATRSSNYMNGILSQWQNISSTYSASTDDSTGGGTDTTAGGSATDSISGASSAS